jgi:hypothetical protein
MAHFAKLDENNLVLSVQVVTNANILKDGVEDEATGIAFLESITGWSNWKQTSYNTRKNKHYDSENNLSADQSKAFRGNSASAGFNYDPVNNIFIEQKPYNSWTLDTANAEWVAPIAMPAEEHWDLNDSRLDIRWDEAAQNWVGFDGSIPPVQIATWNLATSSWDT